MHHYSHYEIKIIDKQTCIYHKILHVVCGRYQQLQQDMMTNNGDAVDNYY